MILQLKSAEKEIQDTGEISQALKQRIVALMPMLEGLWLAFDKELEASERFQELSSQTRSLIAVAKLIDFVAQLGKLR